jgi:hypothetical protein
MPAASKKPIETLYETITVNIGPPTIMPDQGMQMDADAEVFIDFDAKQDAIGDVRRDAGPEQRITRITRAKPSPEPETEL